MKKTVAFILTLLFFLNFGISSSAQSIIIENKSADTTYGGFGAVLNDKCCALLNDYKISSPYEYNEILKCLFDTESGANLDYLFIEIDSDSTYSLMDTASDIKNINPDISVGLIFKDDPDEILSSFEESYESGTKKIIERYLSFTEYSVNVDIIFPLGNNFTDSSDYKLLKEVYRTFHEKNIKVGAICDYSDPALAEKILSDDMLLGIVDAIMLSNAPDDTEPYVTLGEKYEKEIISIGQTKDKNPFSFVSEIMNRYRNAHMTSFMVSPAILCAYEETNYYPDGLITACTPYSGYFECTDLFYALKHFTAFTEKGWQFVKSASSSDYITLKNPTDNSFSVIISNSSDKEKEYSINVSGITFDEKDLKAYTTDFEEKYFESIDIFSDNNAINVTIPPNSVTTLTNSGKTYKYRQYCSSDEARLPLPYNSDFGSSNELPLYFQTLSGKFAEENNKLVQKEVRDKVCPCVIFGDSTWADYKVSADISLANNKSDTYAGISARYVLSDESKNYFSGYTLRIYGDGKWETLKNDYVLGSGKLKDFSYDNVYNLEIEADNMNISAYINKSCVFSCKGVIRSGKTALVSSSDENTFDNLTVAPIGNTPYINKIYADDMDSIGNFVKEESSYLQYDREIIYFNSKSAPQKSEINFSYTGGGFSLIGENTEKCVVDIYLDNEIIAENHIIQKSSARECIFSYESESIQNHNVRIVPKSGNFVLNAAECDEVSKLINENDTEPIKEVKNETVTEVNSFETETVTESDAAEYTNQETVAKDNKSSNIILKSFIFAIVAGGIVFILSFKLK